MSTHRNLIVAVIVIAVVMTCPMASPVRSTPLTDLALKGQTIAPDWPPLLLWAMGSPRTSFIPTPTSVAWDDSSPFFFFLPPLASNPNADANLLDRTLTSFINVTICKPAGANGCAVVDKLTSLSSKSERVILTGEHYQANWQSTNLLRGNLIRIRVDVAGMILGNIDLVLQSPRTIPVKFVIYNNPLVRARVLREQRQTATFIAQVLREEFHLDAVSVAKILRDESFTATEVGRALSDAFAATPQFAASILKNLNYSALQVGAALKDVFNQPPQNAAQILKSVGYTALDIGQTLKNVFGQNASQTAQILKNNGDTALIVGEVLKVVFSQSAAQTALILKNAGYALLEVSGVLKTVFNQDAATTAQILENTGYTATEVGAALKSVFSQDAVAATTILKNIGYTALNIGDALKLSFNEAALGAAQILKNLGFGLLDVGSVLKLTFSQDAITAAQTLKSLGYTVVEVGKVLKETLAQSDVQTATALRAAGYPATQTYQSLLANYATGLADLPSLFTQAGYTAEETAQVKISILAAKFAPVLRFDWAATTFPMPAQTYYDLIIKTGRWNNPQGYESLCKPNSAQLSLFACEPQFYGGDYIPVKENLVPTYYSGAACGTQIRITYWWFYGWQEPCFNASGLIAGHHNGDWERVMVTLSEDSSKIAAVTFYQHGGYLTRLADRGGFLAEGSHPVVYVGKQQHGSYFDDQRFGINVCGYWSDYRNNNSSMDSQNNLLNLAEMSEPWMVADKNDEFQWGYDGVSTHPTRSTPSCDLPACKGKNIFAELETNGCWKSQCKKGDTDTGIECIEDCDSGDYDSGVLTCIKGCSTYPFCGSYLKKRYGYDYTLPTTDWGLFINED